MVALFRRRVMQTVGPPREFSSQSLMSVGADTADHENNVGAIRESPSWEVGRGLFLEKRPTRDRQHPQARHADIAQEDNGAPNSTKSEEEESWWRPWQDSNPRPAA